MKDSTRAQVPELRVRSSNSLSEKNDLGGGVEQKLVLYITHNENDLPGGGRSQTHFTSSFIFPVSINAIIL